jgi:hypothetical protein
MRQELLRNPAARMRGGILGSCNLRLHAACSRGDLKKHLSQIHDLRKEFVVRRSIIQPESWAAASHWRTETQGKQDKSYFVIRSSFPWQSSLPKQEAKGLTIQQEAAQLFERWSFCQLVCRSCQCISDSSQRYWTEVRHLLEPSSWKIYHLVAEHFSESNVEMPMRTKELVEQRWEKRISKCVQDWNKF